MPISGTTDAPTFDGSSADLLRYFQEFDFHANAAGLCGQLRIEAALRYISCDDAETWETLPESTEDDYRAFVTAVKTLYLIDDDIHKEVATFTTDFADTPALTHDSSDLAFPDPDNVITDEILHFATLADIAHLLGPNASIYLSGIDLTCSLSDSEVSEPISDNADTTDSLSIDSAALKTNIDEHIVTEEVVVTASANDLVGLQSTAACNFGYGITDEIPTDRDIADSAQSTSERDINKEVATSVADLAEFTAVPPEFESSEFSELDSIVCTVPEVPLTPPGLPPIHHSHSRNPAILHLYQWLRTYRTRILQAPLWNHDDQHANVLMLSLPYHDLLLFQQRMFPCSSDGPIYHQKSVVMLDLHPLMSSLNILQCIHLQQWMGEDNPQRLLPKPVHLQSVHIGKVPC